MWQYIEQTKTKRAKEEVYPPSFALFSFHLYCWAPVIDLSHDLPSLYIHKYKLYQYPQGGTAGVSDHQSIGRQPGSQHAGKLKP